LGTSDHRPFPFKIDLAAHPRPLCSQALKMAGLQLCSLPAPFQEPPVDLTPGGFLCTAGPRLPRAPALVDKTLASGLRLSPLISFFCVFPWRPFPTPGSTQTLLGLSVFFFGYFFPAVKSGFTSSFSRKRVFFIFKRRSCSRTVCPPLPTTHPHTHRTSPFLLSAGICLPLIQ